MFHECKSFLLQTTMRKKWISKAIFFVTDNYPVHSGESFCSSDISLDDSTNFDHLDEATSDTMSLQNLELQSQSHHNEGISTSSSIANPIDKLYLMQNSYFSTEQ